VKLVEEWEARDAAMAWLRLVDDHYSGNRSNIAL
jgi:hypothetical protein